MPIVAWTITSSMKISEPTVAISVAKGWAAGMKRKLQR